ncbi:hypothetical protein D3C72_1290620 [compost metagenome]
MPVETPKAPASIASLTSSRIAAISSALAARFSSGIARTRNVECPSSGTTLTLAGVARNASSHCAKVSKRNSAGSPSRSSGCGGALLTSGATLMPQLPVTTVVMPCDTLGVMSRCTSR